MLLLYVDVASGLTNGQGTIFLAMMELLILYKEIANYDYDK
jgi:hypothetical protein